MTTADLLANMLLFGLATSAISVLVAESKLFEGWREQVTWTVAFRRATGKSTWFLLPYESTLCRFCFSWWVTSGLLTTGLLCGAFSTEQPTGYQIAILFFGTVGFADWLARGAK